MSGEIKKSTLYVGLCKISYFYCWVMKNMKTPLLFHSAVLILEEMSLILWITIVQDRQTLEKLSLVLRTNVPFLSRSFYSLS